MIEFHLYLDYPVAFAKNGEEALGYLNYLAELGLIVISSRNQASAFVKLTPRGFKHAKEERDELMKQAFIAVWFDPSMEKSIQSMRQAIEACGYTAMCIKNEYFPDTIIEKALNEIQKSRFVVVDLTGLREAVIFEAAFAHGRDKDVIYVRKKDSESRRGFYSGHYQIIEYESTEGLRESLENAIINRIKN